MLLVIESRCFVNDIVYDRDEELTATITHSVRELAAPTARLVITAYDSNRRASRHRFIERCHLISDFRQQFHICRKFGGLRDISLGFLFAHQPVHRSDDEKQDESYDDEIQRGRYELTIAQHRAGLLCVRVAETSLNLR
jgi:hypothetical protein